MTRPDTTRQQIVEIIGNSVYHALALKESLEDERRALEAQDMDALEVAIDNKGNCVDALRTIDDERKALCSAAGFPAGPEQMAQMVEWCDESSVVADSWQHLMDIAADCNALNVTNGAIIQGRRHQIETSIAIVRGGQATTDTYSRSGREPHGHKLRSIAEA